LFVLLFCGRRSRARRRRLAHLELRVHWRVVAGDAVAHRDRPVDEPAPASSQRLVADEAGSLPLAAIEAGGAVLPGVGAGKVRRCSRRTDRAVDVPPPHPGWHFRRQLSPPGDCPDGAAAKRGCDESDQDEQRAVLLEPCMSPASLCYEPSYHLCSGSPCVVRLTLPATITCSCGAREHAVDADIRRSPSKPITERTAVFLPAGGEA
jgi:hypothetical protein